LAITFEPETIESQSKAQSLDSSLVSTKNLSKIFPSRGWHPGPDDLGQKGLKLHHF